MGFLEGLGNVLGTMAAKGQEFQAYKIEYESMSDQELLKMHRNLKDKSGEENRFRRAAIGSILKDRGYTSQ